MNGTHFYHMLPSNASMSIFPENTQDGDNHIYYSDDGYIFLTAFVDYGYYETMRDFVKSVNTTLSKETKGNVSITFDVQTEKVTVHLKNGYQFFFRENVGCNGVWWKRSKDY